MINPLTRKPIVRRSPEDYLVRALQATLRAQQAKIERLERAAEEEREKQRRTDLELLHHHNEVEEF